MSGAWRAAYERGAQSGGFDCRAERLPGMKPNQSRKTESVAWKAAEKDGYDMSLVESNLRKTPYERIRAHSRALATALMLRRAMEDRHARP